MPKNRGKITINQLIQAKRAEKPDAYFWEEFNAELHTKMRLETQRNASVLSVNGQSFWVSLRKTTTVCGAALTCGAFVFLTISNMQMASTGPTHEESFGLLESDPTPSNKDHVAYDLNIEKPSGNTALFIVDEPMMALEESQQLVETVAVSNVSERTAPLHFNTEDFVMEIPNPLADVDIEELIAFGDAKELSGDALAERYMNPLRDLGYASNNNSQGSSSRMRRDLNNYDLSFNSRSLNSSVKKLDSITLIRF